MISRARRATSTTRARVAVVLGVLATLLPLAASVALAPAAEAASYRYWTYWSGERPGAAATWTFSSRGPATDVVRDGTVLGWRFAVTTRAGSDSDRPRQSAGLATVCPSLATAQADRIRVGLVIDYGTAADAPPGQHPPLSGAVRVECVTFPASSRVTGADVLTKAGVSARVQDGLVCGLDGYPTGECAPVVGTTPRPTASPTRTPTRTPSTSPSTAAPTRTAAATTAATPTSSGGPASATPSASATASSTVATTSPSTSAEAAPTDGAGETLPAVSGAPPSDDGGSGNALGFLGGALLVAGVAAAAWWSSRRRGGAG